MNDRAQSNVERINKLWRLHEPWDVASSTEGRCLAFVIDRRYIDEEGVEMRVGVSFGDNVVTPETKQGLIGIPVHPGKFVFGLHGIGTKDNQLTLYDKWQNALDAGDCTDAVQGEIRARAILEAMSDAEYFAVIRSSLEDKRPLQVSNRYLLEDFEVLKGEAW